ncbi:MAG: FkbM family methyltransferase [Bacteroidetes bacterium]|nr:FkbM family methyltransferase [Bacteroidota bacterium]
MIAKLLRALPAFKGKNRLSRILLGRYIKYAQDIEVRAKNGCVFRLPNVKENVGFDMLINGEYEPESIALLLSRVKPGQSFLDIGANIGSIAIPIAKARSESKIICVEASSRMAAYLRQNIAINGLTNVDVIEKAMFNESGKTVNFFNPEEKYGKGSLNSVFTNQSEPVLTITLDELKSRIDGEVGMIKIDIEGYEYFAFDGGQRLLSQPHAPDIYFEFNDWCEEAAGLVPGSSQKILRSLGYSLYGVSGSRFIKINPCLTTGSKMFLATKSNLVQP